MKPFTKKIICDSETPISIFHKLSPNYKYAFLFESAEQHKSSGRYSFLGFDYLKLFVFPPNGSQDPLEKLKSEYQKINYQSDPDLPGLQSGFVGYFCYEVVRHFEKLNLPLPQVKSHTEALKNAKSIPEGIFILPKKILIFDHLERSLTFVAYDQKTLNQLIKEFENSQGRANPEGIKIPSSKAKNSHANSQNYKKLVEISKEKIRAGEVFQIVLSQIFDQKTSQSPFDLYRKLRLRNPSPYMYYLKYPDFSIIGSSPETLVKVQDQKIILRPIAGTRPRGKNNLEDTKLENELKNDSKEKAEHMMLVDLGRNDLGRVSKPGSVQIKRLMYIEKYSHVMHLVSELQGKITAQQNLFNVFKSAFPAGTLTGAPKIRAMEIIAALEKTPRQIYGGAVGYFDLSGNMDFAIAIRTILYQNHRARVQAGAGIVYDSDPQAEDHECQNKARAPLSVIS